MSVEVGKRVRKSESRSRLRRMTIGIECYCNCKKLQKDLDYPTRSPCSCNP